MKKMFFLAVVLLGLVMIIVAADFRRIPGLLDNPPLKDCAGYTIIEYDKGIDCHGDTIRLVRRNGFAERAQL
jgi:hypothetical protein